MYSKRCTNILETVTLYSVCITIMRDVYQVKPGRKEMKKSVNKPKLTADNVERALRFLKGRKAHQHRLKNEAWENEYENAILLIERLTGKR